MLDARSQHAQHAGGGLSLVAVPHHGHMMCPQQVALIGFQLWGTVLSEGYGTVSTTLGAGTRLTLGKPPIRAHQEPSVLPSRLAGSLPW